MKCRPLPRHSIFAAIVTLIAMLGWGDTAASDSAPVRAVVMTTDWSESIGGLMMRAIYQPALHWAAPIDVIIELRADSTTVPEQRIDSDRLATGTGFSIRLINLASGYAQTFTAPLPIDSICTGQRDIPDGKPSVDAIWHGRLRFRTDCDPCSLGPVRSNRDSVYTLRNSRPATFHGALPIGTYSAEISLFLPSQDSTEGGLLVSTPRFDIRVGSIDPDTEHLTFTFPRALRCLPGPVIGWEESDLDTIKIESTPHFDLEYHIDSKLGDFRTGGLPVCPATGLKHDLPAQIFGSELILRPLQRLVFVDGTATAAFHFALTESVRPRSRTCRCAIEDSRRTLWERDLTIDLSSREYDSLTLTEHDLYDYYTIIVPDSVSLGADDTARFSPSDGHLREARCPRGYRLSTLVIAGIDSTIYADDPAPRAFAVTPASVGLPANPVRIEIFSGPPNTDSSGRGDWGKQERVWAGRLDLCQFGWARVATESDVPPESEVWPVRRYFIPRELAATDNLDLVAVPGDSVEIRLERKPGTVLVASVAQSSARWDPLPPDLKGVTVPINVGAVYQDTLVFRLDLYEVPDSHERQGGFVTLLSYPYQVVLTGKQMKRVREQARKATRQKASDRGPGRR